MTTTVELIISENREYLNREFIDLKNFAIRVESALIITDAAFYGKMVKQFLSEKKFNKTHQTESARHILAIKAAEFAKKCCTSAHNRAIVNHHHAAINRRIGRQL